MKILIVEDDVEIAMAVPEGLDDAGYLTHVVRDGERGLKMAAEGNFNLIVLDLMLPSVDGLDQPVRGIQDEAWNSRALTRSLSGETELSSTPTSRGDEFAYYPFR